MNQQANEAKTAKKATKSVTQERLDPEIVSH